MTREERDVERLHRRTELLTADFGHVANYVGHVEIGGKNINVREFFQRVLSRYLPAAEKEIHDHHEALRKIHEFNQGPGNLGLNSD